MLTQSPTVRTLLGALTSDLLLENLHGRRAGCAGLFQPGHRAADLPRWRGSSGIPVDVALGLVVAPTWAAASLAVATTMRRPRDAAGAAGQSVLQDHGRHHHDPAHRAVAQTCAPPCSRQRFAGGAVPPGIQRGGGLVCIGLTGTVARAVQRLPRWQTAQAAAGSRPRHLDPSALATPSLAISCAAREALHQADIGGVHGCWGCTRSSAPTTRSWPKTGANSMIRWMSCTAIKYYMTKISARGPDEREGRRWADIISFTINMGRLATSSNARSSTLRTRRSRRPPVLRSWHGRDQRTAHPPGGQPAPGNERVPERKRARRAKLLEEKPGSAIWSAPTGHAPGAPVRQTRCRALKPARCTST